jgi:hypothetical protein
VNIDLNKQQLGSFVRQLAAFVAIGTQVANVGHLGTVRPILVAAGAILLAIEHYVGDPSTGSTPLTEATGVAVSTAPLLPSTWVTPPSATGTSTVVMDAPKAPAPGAVPQT